MATGKKQQQGATMQGGASARLEAAIAAAQHTLVVFCRRRVPAIYHHLLQLTFETSSNSIVLIDKRPSPTQTGEAILNPIAKFCFTTTNGLWHLYYRDRDSQWQLFEPARPTRTIDPLLAIVERERDRTGMFLA